MSPVGLDELLARLPGIRDPNLLVGYQTGDDAGVYRLSDELAMVTTADFITPPVDDPYVFGQIAAANALSDVYAMGARPVSCLNLVGFPSRKLGPEVLAGIIEGGLERITAAGAVLAGGHTTEDEEPKFGLAVTGLVHPDRVWRNQGARPGDALLLTKPIGSGVLFNARRASKLADGDLAEALAVLIELNRAAAETLALGDFAVRAATDVTGFGLAGHAFEMARAGDVTLELEVDRVPVLPHAREMYQRGLTTGVNDGNRRRVAPTWEIRRQPAAADLELLVDPQTSGGLLVALPAAEADAAVAALGEAGVGHAATIGRVAESDGQHRLRLA